jgi:hypothetical protein
VLATGVVVLAVRLMSKKETNKLINSERVAQSLRENGPHLSKGRQHFATMLIMIGILKSLLKI